MLAVNPISAGQRALFPGLRYAGLLTIAFVSYYVVGRIGLVAPFTSFNVSPVWPAAGVAPVLLYWWGYRLWPGIFAAAFAVNFATGVSAAGATAIAAGNTASAIVGAALLRRALSSPAPLQHVRDVLRFIAVVVVI